MLEHFRLTVRSLEDRAAAHLASVRFTSKEIVIALEIRDSAPDVHVDSLDHMVAEVVRLGGEVLRSKTAVPKTAWYAVVADPEGNIFAVWQPDKAAMPAPEPD